MGIVKYRSSSVIASLAVLCTVCGCGHGTQGSPTAKKTSAPQTVATATASFGTVHPVESLAGIIAPYQNVAISSTLTEPTDTVTVVEGDSVSLGQTLAQLNTDDLVANLNADLATVNSNAASATHTVYQGKLTISQGVDSLTSAQAAQRQAQQSLQRDQTDLQRYQGLLQNGYVSAQQVEQQQTTVRNDQQALRSSVAAVASARENVIENGSLQSQGLQQSSVEQARAQVEVARAQAQQIRVQIGKARIVSPIDGIVVNRNLNPGEYPGTRQIFTIQQVNPIYAVLHGSGQQIAAVGVGDTVDVGISDLGGRTVHGRVLGVLNQITPGSTDFEVKVVLANASGKIRPGMAVSGDIHVQAASGERIPATAFTDVQRDAVQAVDNDGSVRTVHVVRLADDGKTAVVSGIAPGTRVISNGLTTVSPGQKVAVQ